MEVKKATPAIGDPRFLSSWAALVDEVGDSFDWIYAPEISGVLWLGV